MAAPLSGSPQEKEPGGRSDATGRAAPKPGLRARIAWLWNYWRPHKGFLVFLFFFTLVSSAVTVVYPIIWMWIVDRLKAASVGMTGAGEVAPGIPKEAVVQVLLILGAIGMGRLIAGFYPCFRAWMNLRIDVGVREHVFRKILHKDFRFFNKFATGDLVTRLTDDISEYPKIAWFACSGVFRAVDAGSRLLFCIAAMFYFDWRLTLLSLVPLPIMLYIIYRLKTRLSEASDQVQKSISQTNEMLEKTFSGIRIVKAFGAEAGQAKALSRVLDHRIGVQYRLQKLWAAITTLDTAASRVGQLVVLAVGGIMVLQGKTTLGTLYAFYMYLEWLVQPMWDLPNLLVTARQTFVCIDREEELIHFPEAEARPSTGLPLPRLDSLEFHCVSFAYQENHPVVREVSFELARGETVALVGPVASGKSTVLKLLCGLLLPDSGELKVNGRPLSQYRWEEFREKIGVVPQESLLFSETIQENVGMGRPLRRTDSPSIVDEPVETREETWIARVLAAAQMGAELAVMPDGMKTVLGQKGTKVSGGQRQRISIARALYGRPEILLLDDCTASLDAENEDRLWTEIRTVLPEATVLLVSHRLATIRRAQRIVVLDQGRVDSTGTHEELAESSEVYRRFLERAEEREKVMEGEEPKDEGEPV